MRFSFFPLDWIADTTLKAGNHSNGNDLSNYQPKFGARGIINKSLCSIPRPIYVVSQERKGFA